MIEIKNREDKYKFLFLLLPIFILLFSSLVSAAPPVFTEFTGDTGFAIEANVQDYYKVNEGACVHIYVFNRSNGAQLSYGPVTCQVELTDHNGTVVLAGFPAEHEEHFQMCRPSSIVTKEETFGLTITCNNSVMGGYKTTFFEATDSGTSGIPIEYILIFAFIFAYGLIILGFIKEFYPSITMGAIILLVTSLYIWVNGFGILGAQSLIPQFIAAGNFVVASYLVIVSIIQLKD